MSADLTLQFFGFGDVDLAFLRDLVEIYQDFQFDLQTVAVERRTHSDLSGATFSVLTEAMQRTQDGCFTFYHPGLRLEIVQQVAWGQRLGGCDRVFLSASTDNTPYFWGSVEQAQRYAEVMLALGKRIFALANPIFGWCDFNYGLRTWFEDLAEHRPNALYWANYLGSEMVSRLGHEKLARAPQWRLETLEPSGVLYVLGDSPGSSGFHVSVETVRRHFDIEQVR
jgi:hypothetical protein